MPAGACPEEGSLAGGIPEAARPAVGSLEEDSLEEDIPEGENPVEEMSHHLQKKKFITTYSLWRITLRRISLRRSAARGITLRHALWRHHALRRIALRSAPNRRASVRWNTSWSTSCQGN